MKGYFKLDTRWARWKLQVRDFGGWSRQQFSPFPPPPLQNGIQLIWGLGSALGVLPRWRLNANWEWGKGKDLACLCADIIKKSYASTPSNIQHKNPSGKYGDKPQTFLLSRHFFNLAQESNILCGPICTLLKRGGKWKRNIFLWSDNTTHRNITNSTYDRIRILPILCFCQD